MKIVSFVSLFILLVAFPLHGEDCEKARNYFRQGFALGEDLPSLILKEQFYKKAIDLCPSYAEAHNNLGDTFEKEGRFEEAISQYQKALALRSSFSHPYFGLGDICFKTNRPKEATRWYEEGLKYDPSDSLTRARLGLLKGVQEGGLIVADTIRGMLSATRGLGEVVSVTFGEGLIPFDFDRYDIRPDAKAQLDEIGKALGQVFLKDQEAYFEIAGHTDVRGTDQYNFTLSRRRAESVSDYLAKNFDLPRDRLKPNGYGKRVNICTADTSEACHALNRRVEVIKRGAGVKEKTRDSNTPSGGIDLQKIILDVGFFYQKGEGGKIEILTEDSHLRSKTDRYFFFLRPLQDCFVYILQEDSKGRVDFLSPDQKKKDDPSVRVGQDYWIPSFGKAFTLDETKGEEKVYVVATLWPLRSEIEGLTFKEQVSEAIRGLQTRLIKVVRPEGGTESIQKEELDKEPKKIEPLLERIEGEGGWVKALRFHHD